MGRENFGLRVCNEVERVCNKACYLLRDSWRFEPLSYAYMLGGATTEGEIHYDRLRITGQVKNMQNGVNQYFLGGEV